MTTKFERERGCVERLLQDIGFSADALRNPHADGRAETGVDVEAVASRRLIGIQVTELDTGRVAGTARRKEKLLQQEHIARGHRTYFAWGQNDTGTVLAGIARAVTRKAKIAARHDLSGYDENWLLISSNLRELGSVASSYVMTHWLPAEMLTAATRTILQGSKFHRAFLHPIVGIESVLYHWEQATGRWVRVLKAVAA